MDLVERERQLTELWDMLTECAGGNGGAAVIEGGIGCGKTELINAIKAQAAEAGFLVLGAVACWAERQSPGGILSQLLRYAEAPFGPGSPSAELIDGVSRSRATPDAATGTEHQTLDPSTTATLHRLCTEVLKIAERAPILICVDDVQFADAVSVHWIAQLLGHVRSSRVALVFAECTLSKPVNRQLRAELLRLPSYRRIAVNRFSPDGVSQFLGQHLDADTAAALAAECHAVTAGNPLLVRAALEDYRNAAVPGEGTTDLVVGDAYGDAILSCILRGRPVLMRLAEALAVLDEDLDGPGLVIRMTEGEEPAIAERGLHALDAAGLLDGLRLRNAAARAAVLGSIPPRRRAALHRRAAELLYEEGAAVTRIARHLVAAERDLLPWAVPVLRAAAERYLISNRAADAHACVELALQICDDESVRMSLKVMLANAAWLLNPSISARHLGELITALRAGRLPERHAMMLVKFLLWHGRFDEAADAIERIETNGDETDPAGAVEIRATRELLSSTYPALVSSAVRRSGESADPPHRGPAERDPRVQGAAALSYVLANGADEAAVASAEAAMRTMRLGKKTQEWLMCAVAALQFADRLDAAASWCDHWLEEARAWHVPLWEAEFASLRASIALRQGDPLLARRLAETALTKVPAESWGVCIGGPLANLVHAATDTGDYDAAAAYLEVPVPDGMFQSRFGLYYLHARGRYHLESGRPYVALDDFMTCGTLMREWAFDQPALVPWRAEAARAYLALGDVHRARVLAREQLAMVRPGASRTRGMSLRVLAAASPPAERVRLLTEAVEMLPNCGDRLQLAGALADLGRFHHQAGRPARARPAIEMAARLAEASGAKPLLRSLPVESVATDGDRAGKTEPLDRSAALTLLSRAERRVAALAATGHTNREISKRLCVTVSTVEQHLTRTFRKLGVKARRDLPEEIVLELAAELRLPARSTRNASQTQGKGR